MARIQVDTWRTCYQQVLPAAVLESLDPEAFESAWHSTVTAPPSSRHHVLVALEGEWRVGVAAFGPDAEVQPGDPDPDTTVSISLLLVEARWGRRGHGSRLLSAIAELAADDGARRLVAWVPVGDTASLEFYRSAGWAADGRQRSLDTGSGLVNELRLHAALEEA
jgi:GNAT superfamily N-acetyltransferase